MQDNPVTFISKTAARNESLDNNAIPFLQRAGHRGQGLAAGDDGYLTTRFAHHSGFHLAGLMGQRKAMDGNARRGDPGLDAAMEVAVEP